MFSVKKHGPAPVFLIWKLSFTNALPDNFKREKN